RCRDSVVDVHSVVINTPLGVFTQKSFDSTSLDIDLLHKMEKLVHELPGSNIILSQGFLEGLQTQIKDLQSLGLKSIAGQSQPLELFLLPSHYVKPEDLKKFQQPEAAAA